MTFNKRKKGLLKKVHEFAVLLDVEVAIVFKDLKGDLVAMKVGKGKVLKDIFNMDSIQSFNKHKLYSKSSVNLSNT